MTSLSLTLTEFWILIFTERLRLHCPRERGATTTSFVCRGTLDRLAVDFSEVGEELGGAELVLVFGPGVLDVLGGDAGSEASQTRGEVEKPGEIGDPETFLPMSLVVAQSGAGESDAIVVKLPFLIAEASGALEGEFLSGIGLSGPALQR
jgi:hypothetical protein